MNNNRETIIKKIEIERLRQLDLPGHEWDRKNTPSDWIAIASHYISEEVRKSGQGPSSVDFEDSLVKAAAVILAALEHIELMKGRGELK